MMLILLLFGVSVATNTLITESVGVVEVDCSGVLCSVCETSTAYEVEDASNLEIAGYLESVSEVLQLILSELDEYFEMPSYTIAISDLEYCIEVSSYTESPDLDDLYEDLLDVDYEKINLIELFEGDPVSSEVILQAVQGGSSNYGWKSIRSKFDIQSSASINTSVTLNLESIWQIIERDNQKEEYTGNALLYDQSSTEFLIQTQYDRKDKETFAVEIISNDILVGQLADLIENPAACSEVVSPRGLDSALDFLADKATIAFEWDDEYLITHMNVTFAIPKFSVTTGMVIEEPEEAALNVYPSCQLVINGIMRIADLPLFIININSNKEQYWGVSEIKGDTREIKLRDLEMLTKQLYPDAGAVLPKYKDGEEVDGKFEQRISEITIVVPSIEFTFKTEPFIEIKSGAKVVENGDAKIIIYIGRFESVVDTCLILNEITQTAFESLLDLPENTFEVETIQITSSTNTVSLESTALDVDLSFNFGIFLSYNLLSIVPDIDIDFPIEVSGEYFPNDFYTSGSVNNFILIDQLNVTSVSLIQYLEPYNPLYFYGNLTFRADKSTILSFDSFVYTNDDNIKIEGYMVGEWNPAFEIETLSISLLKSKFIITDDSLSSQRSFGIAEYQDDWVGTVSVMFDLEDPVLTVGDIYMGSTDGDTFWSNVLELDPTVFSDAFVFNAGTALKVQNQTTTITTPLSFMNVPSYLLFNVTQDSEEVLMDMNMLPFTLAFGNAWIYSKNDTVPAQVSAEVSETSGTIEALVNLFEITNEVSILLSDSTLSFSLFGAPFRGVYNFTFIIEALTTPINIYDIDYSLTTTLEEEYKEDLESIPEMMIDWVTSGISTLEYAYDQVQAQNDTVNSIKPCDGPCPQIDYCTTPLQQVCTNVTTSGTCSEYDEACFGVIYECEDYETICASETTYCAEFSKTIPNVCDESETVCEIEYNVCTEWTLTCEETGYTKCSTVSFGDSGTSCKIDGFNCEEQKIDDPACLANCTFTDELLAKELEDLQLFTSAFNATYNQLQGFYELQDVELVVLNDVKLDYIFEKSGVGPHDLNFLVEFEYYSAEEQTLVEAKASVIWDFYSEDKNKISIFNAIKDKIIDDSELTDELKEKPAFEIYLENF